MQKYVRLGDKLAADACMSTYLPRIRLNKTTNLSHSVVRSSKCIINLISRYVTPFDMVMFHWLNLALRCQTRYPYQCFAIFLNIRMIWKIISLSAEPNNKCKGKIIQESPKNS